MTPPLSRETRRAAVELAGACAELAVESVRFFFEALALGADLVVCRAVGHKVAWRQTTIGQRPFCGRCGSQLR